MRRAQAAMEFLMTYGWAILVVLVVIGALAYFGVLSPSSLLPEKCTFPLQVSCRDHQIDVVSAADTDIKFTLQNGAGKGMRLVGVAIYSEALANKGVGCRGTVAGGSEPLLPNGDSGEILISSSGASTILGTAITPATAGDCVFSNTGRDKNRYNVSITYRWADSTYDHTMIGELFAKTE